MSARASNPGDAENWFGPPVSSEPVGLVLDTPHRDATAGPAELTVTLQGVTNDPTSANDHRVRVRVNGADAGTLAFDGQANTSQTFSVPASLLADGSNTIELTAENGDADLRDRKSTRLNSSHT